MCDMGLLKNYYHMTHIILYVTRGRERFKRLIVDVVTF